MKKRLAAIVLCAIFVIASLSMAAAAAEGEQIGDTSVEAVSAEIDGTVYEGELSNGASYFAYIPANENYGNRATSNPILIVYGDGPFTAESAKDTVIASGLGDIADHEQGPVILVNPVGETWSAEDQASYLAIKDIFSDGTGNGYGMYSEKSTDG